MLHSLLFLLALESMQPSPGTLFTFVPSQILAEELLLSSNRNPSLATLQAPTKKDESSGPVLEAASVFAVDVKTGTPLFAKDIFTRRSIASIAKLVTAMVVLDSHSLNEIATISKNAASQEGSSMGLKTGEKITVHNLLMGLLIKSGNDAAVALAEFDAESEDKFVKKLNEKATALHLRNTHFSNAKGFDDEGNYSTAFDTIAFSRTALSYPFIIESVAKAKAEVTSTDGKLTHSLESTNQLLDNQYFTVRGLKTGHTPAAGESFVALAIAENGHEILTVVLNSPDRFKETKILLDWIFRHFTYA